MNNENCLFCKLATGKLPASKFWENEDYIAILDINPNVKGATLIISKQHVCSDVFKADPAIVHKGLDACIKAVEILMAGLVPDRVALVTEGLMIDHLHFKLYPIYNAANDSGPAEKVFFESFPGYITTQLGPQWSREELEGLAARLRKTKA